MMAVEWLSDAPGTVRDLPVFGSVHPMRDVTRQVAFEGRWDGETRSRVAELFDSMAERWTADHDRPDKRAAIGDALDRGGITPGRTVELGSGSGIGTEELAARGHEVVALDLSLAMLLAAPAEHGARVQGDSSALPFPSDAVDTVACVNMLLFPGEVDRILTEDGVLVWVNTMAEETPIHLPPEDVVAALPGSWRAVAGRAGTGLWCVARRA